jgi:hypothetical protein
MRSTFAQALAEALMPGNGRFDEFPSARPPFGRIAFNLGHPATRRWGPHHKLESRPNPPFSGFSNGL